MLLVVDVGNTNTVLGVFDGKQGRAGEVRAHWRLETRARRTADEYAATLHELFQLGGLPWKIEGGIVATVVPPALFAVEKLFERGSGAAHRDPVDPRRSRICEGRGRSGNSIASKSGCGGGNSVLWPSRHVAAACCGVRKSVV